MLMLNIAVLSLALSTNHPLLMCMFLIAYSSGVGVSVGVLVAKWFMAAIILIFLGGMMIIFFYATSLSISDKFVLNSDYMLHSLVWPLFFVGYFYFFNNVPSVTPLVGMTEIYSSSSFNTIIFLMFYLIFTLFLIVKVSLSFKGPLIRKF